mmetsp:Transcript_44616/g.97154  ORF Transcript_44616/g.97154 Transcript_44616/m.97154 type:complete len:127 (-) Transcript_44616:1216-1596(-)
MRAQSMCPHLDPCPGLLLALSFALSRSLSLALSASHRQTDQQTDRWHSDRRHSDRVQRNLAWRGYSNLQSKMKTAAHLNPSPTASCCLARSFPKSPTSALPTSAPVASVPVQASNSIAERSLPPSL